MAGVTEDTVSDLLASYLRREGVDALTQFTVDFPRSWGKPDIKLENGGYYFGEAEWEGKEWEGFGEARDYLQAPNASGTFLITYPNELKKKLSQSRLGKSDGSQLSRFESVLSNYKYKAAFLRREEKTDMKMLEWEEIPQWFRLNIKAKIEPYQDLDWSISILRQTAEELTDELGSIEEPELFRNILGSSSGTKEQEQAASKAAGYLLVNQITFYRILSSVRDLPDVEVDELESPQDLNQYFSKVLEIDYSPVFSYPIASAFSQKSLTLLKNAVKSIYALSPERIGHEALGRVFHELIPLSIRKSVAAYYTKHKAGKILAELSIDDSSAEVIDPACGSGTLLSHTYSKKRELSDQFDQDVHRRFVEEEITGIDIMPFAAHLSTINLALEAPQYPTDKVRIGIEDSTKLEPGKSIPPLSRILPEDKKQRQLEDWIGKPAVEGEEVERGAVAMDALPGKEIKFGKVDNLIMNPPFTRAETIADFSKGYKNKLERRFSEAERNGILNRQMSFCSYFLLLANKFLKDDGRIAAVLPASMLRKKGDRELREMFSEEYNLEYIMVREDNPNFSETTDLREILFILKKGKSNPNFVSLVIINDLDKLSISHLEKVCNSVNENKIVIDDYFELRKFNQENLDKRNFFRPISTSNYNLIELWDDLADEEKLVRIGREDISIIRGGETASTGSISISINAPDSPHLKKGDIWITKKSEEKEIIASSRHTEDEISVPRNCLISNLRRETDREFFDVSSLEEYIVCDKFEDVDFFLKLCNVSEPDWKRWKNYLSRRTSKLSVSRKVDISAPGTRHLSYYSKTPRIWIDMWSLKGLDKNEAKISNLWFNSSFHLLQFIIERSPVRGAWTRLDKYVLKEMKILDSSSLTDREEDRMLILFEEFSGVRFPSIWKQLAMNSNIDDFTEEEIEKYSEVFDGFKEKLSESFAPRRKIDMAILNILGYRKEKCKEILKDLYPDLLKEIAILKRMMD